MLANNRQSKLWETKFYSIITSKNVHSLEGGVCMLHVDSKFYTWQELVEEFPDKWIVVTDATLDDGGFILSGRLIGVCSDTEIDDFVISCYREDKQISYERTTEESGVGIVNVKDFVYETK